MQEELKTKVASPNKSLNLPFQRKKQLERDIEHITGEMYRRNKELADTNKTLSLLRMIDALALEPHVSFKRVCNQIVSAITDLAEYPLVGLLVRSEHIENELLLQGWSVKDETSRQLLNFERPLMLNMDHDWFSEQKNGHLISLDNVQPTEIADFLKHKEKDVAQFLEQVPLKSVYILKLRVRRHIVGVLVVGLFEPPDRINITEIELLDRLSDTIGVALDNKLLFEENRRVARQLKESNIKLLSLDEAKDDFISMASHQLRTPLTSVKGYLSMVIDGDVGDITSQQHKLLSQAYASSQRMVYIIADLLNVSRLRTGKFVMELSPINLADIVEQEVTQLKEIASAREVELVYDKPSTFPMLMLDETKTRQVIMNFVDNAIYYTRPQGKIVVSLVDKGPIIEYKVLDDGIGVPAGERHHLFTKFYRATNARKSRPDGTGLGLFMAKKVIIAQGGAIIFDSTEGKGSTFGFMMSKAKHLPPENKAT